MLKCNLTFQSWNGQRQRALLCICIWLMPTLFTQDLTPWFESKNFVNWCLRLMLYNIFLYWVGMCETWLYQMIYESNCKLLCIFLLSKTITGQYLPHKWLDYLCLCSLRLISLPNVKHISTQQTFAIKFLLFTKIDMIIVCLTKLVQWNSMS